MAFFSVYLRYRSVYHWQWMWSSFFCLRLLDDRVFWWSWKAVFLDVLGCTLPIFPKKDSGSPSSLLILSRMCRKKRPALQLRSPAILSEFRDFLPIRQMSASVLLKIPEIDFTSLYQIFKCVSIVNWDNLTLGRRMGSDLRGTLFDSNGKFKKAGKM